MLRRSTSFVCISLLMSCCSRTTSTRTRKPKPIEPTHVAVPSLAHRERTATPNPNTLSVPDVALARANPLSGIASSSVVFYDLDRGSIRRVCSAELQLLLPRWDAVVVQGFPQRPRCAIGKHGMYVCNLSYYTNNHQTVFLSAVLGREPLSLVGVGTSTGGPRPALSQLQDNVELFFAMIGDSSIQRCDAPN